MIPAGREPRESRSGVVADLGSLSLRSSPLVCVRHSPGVGLESSVCLSADKALSS